MAVKSTSSSLSILEELLTCSVCLEFFANPKTLPCHHSFCQTCLEKLPKENAHSFLCPTCRCRTQVPDGGVAGLPTAFYLSKCKEMHSQIKKEIKCDNCDKNNAAGYCKMCHESLCTSCIEVHNRWSRFSNHKIVDIHLMQNLAIVFEQVREMKVTLDGIFKKEEDAKHEKDGIPVQLSANICIDEQWGNIDQLLYLLDEEKKLLEAVLETFTEIEQLLFSLKDLHTCQVKSDSKAIVKAASGHQSLYFGAAFPYVLIQQCTITLDKVECNDAGLLSFSLSIKLPASSSLLSPLIIPVSSIKCRLIPMIKEREQDKDKYKITTTSGPGIYQIDCCPLASGAHSLSVHIYDVQLESVSLMVPFNPHFDTIAPAHVIYGLKSPSGIAGGNDGLVILDNNNGCYVSLSDISSSSTSLCKKHIFNRASSICISSSNNVIIASEEFVEILTLEGTTVKKITNCPFIQNDPNDIAVSSYIYIAESYRYYNSQVHILSSDLTFIRSFGGRGSKNGEFSGANGIAIAVIDGEEFLYVTDGGNHRIQKFTYHGEFLSTFGTQGSDPGQLQNPYGIAVGTGNLLYITESGNHRISVFTFGGDFIRCFGGKGSNIDQFSNPSGITFDSKGVMYVCDSSNNRLLLY